MGLSQKISQLLLILVRYHEKLKYLEEMVMGYPRISDNFFARISFNISNLVYSCTAFSVPVPSDDFGNPLELYTSGRIHGTNARINACS